jgi:hypothetical protein
MQYFIKIIQNEDFKINTQHFKSWLDINTIQWLFIEINNFFLSIFTTDKYSRTAILSNTIKKKIFQNNLTNFKNSFIIHLIKDDLEFGKYLLKHFINQKIIDNIDVTIFKIFTINGYTNHKLLSIIKTANSKIKLSLTCSFCSKQFSTTNYRDNHEKNICSKQNDIINQLTNENKVLKQKIKHNKSEQSIINITQNNIIQNANTINNIQILSKKQKLDHYYPDTIDIDTFITKYKNEPKYQLTYDEAQSLLDVLEFNGYLSYANGLTYCIKQKCKMIFNDINQDTNKKQQAILPFVMSDAQLRTHFQKNNQSWNIVKNTENIKKILNESNNQLYKHHHKNALFSSKDTKKVINNILRHTDITQLQFTQQTQPITI